MTGPHVVVDGSNIATEGRTTPSLAQLESAIEELRREMPDAEIIVVVDATFAHRIDAAERPRFEEAQLRGEYVSPPAGAIGRGDAFILRIVDKVDGIALSNDSFQEFHGDHAWLFEPGRLIGASLVPGVGWIFIPRNPVRGPRSRVAVRATSRAKKSVASDSGAAHEATVTTPMPRPKIPPPGRVKVTADAEPAPAQRAPRRRTSRSRVENPDPVNDPTTFITFIAEHPLGKLIDAEVESFTSHGAVIRYGEVHCYAPLAALGDPPPRSAREVLHRGDVRTFVVAKLDPQRRGVEVALPGVTFPVPTPPTEADEHPVEIEPPVGRGRATSSDRGGRAGEAAAEPSEVAATRAGGGRGRRSRASASEVQAGAPSPSEESDATRSSAPRRRPRRTSPVVGADGATVAIAEPIPPSVELAEPVPPEAARVGPAKGGPARKAHGTASAGVVPRAEGPGRAAKGAAKRALSSTASATPERTATPRSASANAGVPPTRTSNRRPRVATAPKDSVREASANTGAATKTARSRVGSAATGPTKTGPTKTGPTKTSSTTARPTKTSSTTARPTKTSSTTTGSTKSGPAKTSPGSAAARKKSGTARSAGSTRVVAADAPKQRVWAVKPDAAMARANGTAPTRPRRSAAAKVASDGRARRAELHDARGERGT